HPSCAQIWQSGAVCTFSSRIDSCVTRRSLDPAPGLDVEFVPFSLRPTLYRRVNTINPYNHLRASASRSMRSIFAPLL
ncbi:MAG: hypothetical protein LWX83_02195, partial [Anaerolineae bacterium]|nr:hypothetical protein [Anaerolineae bacterium]